MIYIILFYQIKSLFKASVVYGLRFQFPILHKKDKNQNLEGFDFEVRQIIRSWIDRNLRHEKLVKDRTLKFLLRYR